ncbi:hypothetical protein BKM15_25930 [Pseudomonas syringae pv. syringae]|nr:hypothetical protein BKM15_25930 [Pseudomonas syringae pv. syringae]
MPKYIAEAYLVHEGAIIQEGQTVELSEEQAERLGDKVSPSTETALEEKTVPELKEMAKDRNIEGYNDMKKAELVEVLSKEE